MKNGSGSPFKVLDAELKALLDTQIAALEAKIETAISADPDMAGTARILRSITGVGPVTSWMLIARNARAWSDFRRTGRSPHRPRTDRA